MTALRRRRVEAYLNSPCDPTCTCYPPPNHHLPTTYPPTHHLPTYPPPTHHLPTTCPPGVTRLTCGVLHRSSVRRTYSRRGSRRAALTLTLTPTLTLTLTLALTTDPDH